MFRSLLSVVFAVAFAVSSSAAPSANPGPSNIRVRSANSDISSVFSPAWWKNHHPHNTLTVSAPSSPTDTPSPSSTIATPPVTPTQSLSADQEAYLRGQNAIRMQHSAVNLTWSDELAAAAQKWADGCKFQHSAGTLGPYGENLTAGTGNYTIPAAITVWASEASQYHASNPSASHFTQMVWKSTTEVGCAVASCNNIFEASLGVAQYYVCEYYPAGNVVGEFTENVQS